VGLLHRGYVEGPLGFPVKGSVARELEGLHKGLPNDSAYEYRRLARSAAKVDVEAEQRWHVSAITTDDKGPGRRGRAARGPSHVAGEYGRTRTTAASISFNLDRCVGCERSLDLIVRRRSG
jgi:hypothetical protein